MLTLFVFEISENRFFSQDILFEEEVTFDNGFEVEVFVIPEEGALFILAIILSTDAFTGISS